MPSHSVASPTPSLFSVLAAPPNSPPPPLPLPSLLLLYRHRKLFLQLVKMNRIRMHSKYSFRFWTNQISVVPKTEWRILLTASYIALHLILSYIALHLILSYIALHSGKTRECISLRVIRHQLGQLKHTGFGKGCTCCAEPSERLPLMGIRGVQLRSLLKPLNIIAPWCSRGLRGRPSIGPLYDAESCAPRTGVQNFVAEVHQGEYYTHRTGFNFLSYCR